MGINPKELLAEIADVMDEVMNKMFSRLENVGTISDKDLVIVMTLSLIDEYEDEMVRCNHKWQRTLDDLVMKLSGESCLTRGISL